MGELTAKTMERALRDATVHADKHGVRADVAPRVVFFIARQG